MTQTMENHDDICPTCGGTGEIEKREHVTGDNIVPGGFYEGSGEYDPCPDCQGGPDDDHCSDDPDEGDD